MSRVRIPHHRISKHHFKTCKKISEPERWLTILVKIIFQIIQHNKSGIFQATTLCLKEDLIVHSLISDEAAGYHHQITCWIGNFIPNRAL